MDDKIDQQHNRTPQEKVVDNPFVHRPEYTPAAHKRLEAASSQCYVIGGLFVSIGGAVGLASPYYNWCIALCLFGSLIITVGILLHRRATVSEEFIETLHLTPPEKSKLDEIKKLLTLPPDRPELALRLKFGDFTIGKPMGMEFQVENITDVNAFNFRIWTSYKTYPFTSKCIATGKFNETLQYGHPVEDRMPNTPKIAARQFKYVKPVIDYCPTLTPNLTAGVESLFLFGLYWFEDAQGKEFKERYCFVFNPLDPVNPFDCPGQITARMVAELPRPTTRPELSIDTVETIFRPNAPTQVLIQFTNRGSGTAYNSRIKHWCFSRPIAERGQRVPTPPPVPKIGILPTQSVGAINHAVLTMHDIPISCWKDVVAEAAEFFLLLKVTYTDDEGKNTYGFDRCWRWSNNIDRLCIADPELWPEGFNPDS